MGAEEKGPSGGQGPLPKKLLLIQPMMMKVVYGLMPCLLGSVYFFGLRALAVTLLVLVLGIAAEGLFTLRKGKPVTSAVVVTCLIFSMSLPPTIPFWMACVGIVFGVVFGKMVFGGFGHNLYNPAMVGRCFLYITFPMAMTNRWTEPFAGGPGGLTQWVPGVDAVTGATALALFKTGHEVPLGRLFFGNVAGSLGETSALLILAGGLFIVLTKAAPWRMAVSCLCGGLASALVLYAAGGPSFPDPLTNLLAGSFLFGAFFVVTEPISGPKTRPAQWIYGFVIGALTLVLRKYSNFSEGIMFSVLFMNTFVSSMDIGFRSVSRKRAAGDSA